MARNPLIARLNHRTVTMRNLTSRKLVFVATLLVLTLLPGGAVFAHGPEKNADNDKDKGSDRIENLRPYLNDSGFISTYNMGGDIDTRNAFFKDLGTNGRTCATCHQPSQAFSFTAQEAKKLFAKTKGRDPLFAPVDGANCSNAKTGNAASHSLILGAGLIRVAIPVPEKSPQFTVNAAYDPYGCALDTSSGSPMLSFYRRPLPSTNLRFLSAVMWDARETGAPLNDPSLFAANLTSDLTSQALDATLGHAQASSAPSAKQLAEIVNFELGLSTAQVWDFGADLLMGHGVSGGPMTIAQQTYYPGINDSLTPTLFSPAVFTLYDSWTAPEKNDAKSRARAAIAAGEKLFNSFPINITAVRGLNDNAALGMPSVIPGTCGTCHDAPNAGDHSLPLPLDIGTGHASAFESDPQIKAALAKLSFPNLPIYKVTGCTDPFTGASPVYTTDLGKAALTGQCTDLNRIKGPVLRGLAGRAPYFHNGAAATLDEVVDFYNQRFKMGLTDQQKAELVAFLRSL